jgi:hypothetical protein
MKTKAYGGMAVLMRRTFPRGLIPMKMYTFVLTIVLLCGLADPLPAEDVQQVFSGIPWGSSITAFQGLRETARSGDIAFYKRDKDIYSIANVALTDIIYGFYDGKFFSVYLKISNPDDIETIKTSLDKVYGPARAQLRLHQTIYIWDYLDVKIKLKQPRDASDAKLAYYYVPLSIKANASQPDQGQTHIFELEDGLPEFEF